MNIINGRVKFAAGNRTFPSRFDGSPQQNIVVTLEDGSEERIYFSAGRQPHASLQKGQPVQIEFYMNNNGQQSKRLLADTPSYQQNNNYQQRKPQQQRFSQPQGQQRQQFNQRPPQRQAQPPQQPSYQQPPKPVAPDALEFVM